MAVAARVIVPLTVLPLLGEVRVAVGAVVSAASAAAWLTVKVFPPMLRVPLRALVLVLAATE